MANAKEKKRTVFLPTGDTYIIPEGDKGHFLLIFEWPITLEIDGVTHKVTIPCLLSTDFASIPKILHSMISPLNNTIYAAIMHDFFYRNPSDSFANLLSRETIDRAFYWGMQARGVSRTLSGLMYIGVRVGGKSSYKR